MIGTSPPAGTQLSTGQAVTLLISRGTNTVIVPNVVGLDDQAALAALGNAGLSGTEVQRDSTEPEGKVLSQSPAAGKQVARGSQVTIFASTGAITVPNVVGQHAEGGRRRALKKAGLRRRGDRARPRPTRPRSGVVISEFPPGGSRGQRGDTVTISVGVTSPDLDDAMRVAVLGGGISSEHEVSLRSAASVAGGLREAGHETVEVTIERDGGWSVDGEAVSCTPGGGLLGCDVAFPVLHGPGGEDGSVQGLLEVLDVPYAGSDVEASAVCMDKLVFKDLLARHGCRRWTSAAPERTAGASIASGVRPAGLGEARPPRLERRDLTGLGRGGARRGRGGCAAPRPAGDRRGARPGQGGRVLAARQRGAASPRRPGRSSPKADWYDYEAKYAEGGMELRRAGRRSPIGPRRALRELARQRVHASAAAAASPAVTSSSMATRCWSTSSTRSPASPRPASTASSSRRTASPTRSSATAWSSSRSSATSDGAALRVLAAADCS